VVPNFRVACQPLPTLKPIFQIPKVWICRSVACDLGLISHPKVCWLQLIPCTTQVGSLFSQFCVLGAELEQGSINCQEDIHGYGWENLQAPILDGSVS